MKIIASASIALGLSLLFAFEAKQHIHSIMETPSIGTSAQISKTTQTLYTTQDIVNLADAFKATLTASQITTLQLSYSLSNAKTWSNLPAGMSPRLGLKLGSLSSTQLAAAKALIQAMTGTTANEGYNEVEESWLADDYLAANGASSATYGSGYYYLAFFGTPSMTGTFEIIMTGHHKTVANTYINGSLIGATPHFSGIEPFASFTQSGTTCQPIVQERDAFAAMLSGLTTTELATAHQSSTFSDLVLGPGQDWVFPSTKIGLRANTLTTAQRQLIMNAINTYVDDVDDVNAATILAKYAAELDDTYIAYSGNASLTVKNDYVRIDGPSVWIEYSTQNGIVLTPTHPHSVWRDHVTDYGGTGNPSAISSANNGIVSLLGNYPNPVNENTSFSFSLKEKASVKISIFDLSGKLIMTPYQNDLVAGNHAISADLSALKQGVYVYCVEANGKVSTSKLVKN